MLTAAFSVAFGRWVFGIIAQSYDRASLIEQLGQTRAELARANRRAGVLAERQRLSGEIHDTVAQGFTSIIMLLQAADADVERQPAAARGHLALALQTARDNLAEARALVAALAPAGLEPGALDAALRRLAATAAGHPGTAARFEVTRHGRPAAPARRGHAAPGRPGGAGQRAQARPGPAGASSACGTARDRSAWTSPTTGRVSIPGRRAGGYGLPGMRARAEEAGGRLEVRSSPGCGTTVSVVVPVPGPAVPAGPGEPGQAGAA